ncbi:BlaI/MecI/CopY family transcriptional regulator [Halioxenophilus sp. WMMB6]|uniref:BlaI/MecI/CopY family transcriptional regulator n=1 Tax=Halioxenophilus sp. WMMB6 TaxID=3073815 RepID=UPI00295EFD3E|nr:BlaI/MecI/CopY family transcriptional regulator [Halioxenophilus sp. WMMB6]
MSANQIKGLSRRERQIIESLYNLELASVQQVLDTLEDAPSYSTVRALLNRMVEKGQISYRREGNKYLYFPSTDRDTAAESAMKKLVRTFFKGSTVDAVTALLGSHKDSLTEAQVSELEAKIKQLKSEQGNKK